MGNPQVIFSHTIPLPLHTAPVKGMGINCTMDDTVFYETHGMTETCHYLADTTTNGILESKKYYSTSSTSEDSHFCLEFAL